MSQSTNSKTGKILEAAFADVIMLDIVNCKTHENYLGEAHLNKIHF